MACTYVCMYINLQCVNYLGVLYSSTEYSKIITLGEFVIGTLN